MKAAALAVLLLACATASGEDTTPPADPDDAGVMIREASLPEGFPAPGKINEVVVKQYPAYRMAKVAAADVETRGRRGQDGMFGVLFRHIKSHDIPMTAPVEMQYPTEPVEGDAAGTEAPAPAPVMMGFLYGAPSWGEAGRDGVVDVVDVPAMTVVSVGVRGGYTNERVAAAVEKLRAFIADSGGKYEAAGPPRLLGYNSPFVPAFLRYGEVQVPVRVAP